MSSSGIAIFDSGIGGVALLKAVRELLPNEHLIYLADTANFPYGSKNSLEVRTCVTKILQYFVEYWQPKAILIACNTASVINQQSPCLSPNSNTSAKVWVYDMIQPTVDYVQNNYHNYHNIGIIATPNTINSAVYQQRLPTQNFRPQIQTLPTPTLATAIENSSKNELIQTIHNYLGNPILAQIQALLIACTHYAWVKNEISAYYEQQKRQVAIIDSINIVAHNLQQDLIQNKLVTNSQKNSQDIFITTSYAPNFQQKIQQILPANYQFQVQQISLS